MIESENNTLPDKPTIYLDSFQEGFKLLSDSKNLDEIEDKFVHLLRDNLLHVDVNLFYKSNIDSEWTSLVMFK